MKPVRRRLLPLLVLSATLPGALSAQPGDQQEQTQWLLSQARRGEALYRDELVRDSLTRLQLIAPDHPEVLAVDLRLALRQQDTARVAAIAAKLERLAPGSHQARQAQALRALAQAPGHQILQQARLAALAGRREQALALFERLFADDPPTLELAIEYWRLRSAQHAQRPSAIAQLRSLERLYPGNIQLRLLLVDLLFDEGHTREALALLGELARQPAASAAAAKREFDYLSEQPVSRATAQAWEAFVARYPQGQLTTEARRIAAEQQRLLNDPHWQAGQHGLSLLDSGRNAEAERQLRQALRHYPDDAALLGGLGLALLRQHQRQEALGYFEQAKAKEADTDYISKWHDLVVSTRHWLLLERAEALLAAGDTPSADRLYRQALHQRPGNVFALLGLAQVAEARGEADQAERHYQQALRHEAGNESALRGLVRLHLSQSPDQALRFIDSLPPSQRRQLLDQRNRILLERYKREADLAAERHDWAGVTAATRYAHELDPDDPWLAFRLANSLLRQGQLVAGDAVFHTLLARQAGNPVARYAHALYLTAQARTSSALSSLEAIPKDRWSEDMRHLTRRILQTHAGKLRGSGHEAAAIKLIEAAMRRHGRRTEDLVLLAGWAQQRGEHARALALLDEASRQDPTNAELRLARVESWIATGELARARSALLEQPPQFRRSEINPQRRLASAWVALGEPARAQALYAQLLSDQQLPDPLLHRDAARLLAEQDPQAALDLYARGMHDAGLLDAEAASPRDNRALTRASRARQDDDWLSRSLRSDVEQLYLRQAPSVTLLQDHGWRNDEGTSGLSDLRTDTSLLHIEWPMGQGRGFLRAEQVSLDAGRFALDADGRHREEFGSCQLGGAGPAGAALPSGCPGGAQHADGTLLAFGWQDRRLATDLGLSQGFEIDNLYGGIAYSGELGAYDWSLSASRRPMSNSLLSYGGATDPRTGIRWGGVTANGATLGLSWDQDGAHGLWVNLGQHWMRGRNVADNRRTQAMAGYYYKLIDHPDERLRTGLTLMHLGYDRDLGGYSLGQGGYWSPQRYASIGVPLSYAWRQADWSLTLEGSISWSRSHSDDSRRYPLASLNRALLARYALQEADLDATRTGGGSHGLGYRLQGLLEHRLSDYLVLGGGISWLYSEDYAPSRALLYLRYSPEPWQGNLPLPAQPLTPYADFP